MLFEWSLSGDLVKQVQEKKQMGGIPGALGARGLALPGGSPVRDFLGMLYTASSYNARST